MPVGETQQRKLAPKALAGPTNENERLGDEVTSQTQAEQSTAVITDSSFEY